MTAKNAHRSNARSVVFYSRFSKDSEATGNRNSSVLIAVWLSSAGKSGRR